MAALLTEVTEIAQTIVKKDLSNSSMAALLTEFTELIQNIVKINMPREEQLEQMAVTLEGVTDELKTYCSSWKTATQQAEDGARQMAQGNEEIEETKKNMADKNEELEETSRQIAKKNEELEEKRKQIEKREEQLSRKERLYENRLTDLKKKEELVQQFQSTVTKALRELTEAVPKAQADAQRSLVNYDVSRFEAIRAKRGLGPTSPKPPPKRRRYAPQSSVGSGEMPTDTSRTVSTPSGAQGLLGSSIGSSSSMNPATATATRQTIFNPESSSPGTLIQSSQSTVSATCPPGLSGASNEVKDVWRQIEFPADWDAGASQTLLHGFNKATNKKTPPNYRPAGLLDYSSTQPNCFLCRVSKIKSALDNSDGKSCSNCKAKNWPCVRVSFMTDDLANVEYDEDGEEKRWKLTIREG